jgi:hypothetical protein
MKAKTIVLCASLASLAATFASAEEWQLTMTPGQAFVSYAEVHVTDSSGREVAKTFADRLGRVGAALPNGKYHVSAKAPDGRMMSADVQVVGAAGLQTLPLK